jgi:energy-coupling factor transporter transmembrane protein EcfT
MIIYQDTYLAMVSRGYEGKVMFFSKNHFTIKDFIVLLFIVLSGIVLILFKR